MIKTTNSTVLLENLNELIKEYMKDYESGDKDALSKFASALSIEVFYRRLIAIGDVDSKEVLRRIIE